MEWNGMEEEEEEKEEEEEEEGRTTGRRKTEKDKQDPGPQPDFNPARSEQNQQAGAIQSQHSTIFSCEPSIGGGTLLDG